MSCQPVNAQTATPDRPNILFILTDDQGVGDLSSHGNPVLTTPATDELLESGAEFTRFYVNPVCAPTRASFLSGQYSHRTGAYFVTRRAETMTDSVQTIPEVLATNGYQSGLFGKWHNGATYPYNPAGQGFDEFLGFCMGHHNRYYDYFLEDETSTKISFTGYITDVLADSAYQFMMNQQTAGIPFFCMLALPAPHTPVQGPGELFEKYQDKGVDEFTAGVYAMIEANDLAIGRLMRQLKESGLDKNTIVIFSTDNGPNGNRYNQGLRGKKGQVDEGGVRVPFAIKFPGNHPANGKKISTVAAHIDLLPTLAELTETPLPVHLQPIDGKSIVPLLNTPQLEWPARNIYTFTQGYEFSPFPGAMRNQDQVYIMRDYNQSELYDLNSDPGQQTNLFDPSDPSHQQMATDYLQFSLTVTRSDLVAPPIEIGHQAAPSIQLLAHEGEPFGQAVFHDAYGWANDWVENINSPDSGINWPLKVIRNGIYAITIEYAYTGKTTDKTALRLNFSGKRRQLYIKESPNSDLPTRDLVKRKEVYPRTWQILRNNVSLSAGLYDFKVAMDEEMQQGELSIKSVTLKRIN